jgi:ABC-type cobalt transport system substrate-binding protein
MRSFNERYAATGILAALFCFLLILSFLTQGYYGGGDNIAHYFIARYAYKYPELFLNPWGRPFYTIFSSPFAQFGLHGSMAFNVILGTLTAWLSWRTAKKLDLSPAWIVPVIVCFTPLYFIMIPTALTEILFSFILVLAIYLFFSSRLILSAVVLSFIPFARSEGYILLPIFILAFLFRKKFVPIPFLATGTIIFNGIGWIAFKDPLWVIHAFPYAVHHSIYDKTGPLFNFLVQRDMILGLPVEIIFIAGTLALVIQMFSKDQKKRNQGWYEFLLIFLPFFIYTAFHAYVYWKGAGGSLGLIRVLAAVLPLAAIIGLKGFGVLEKNLAFHPRICYVLRTVLIVFVILYPFKVYDIPFPLQPEESLVKESVSWVKNSRLDNRYLYYTDLTVPFFMGLDWKDVEKSTHIFYRPGKRSFADHSIVIWDAHYGPNECNIPLDTLLRNPQARLIQLFEPPEEMITFGGNVYQVCVFLIEKDGMRHDNYALLDSLKPGTDRYSSQRILDYTFEENYPNTPAENYTGNPVHGGSRSFIVDKTVEYSPGLTTVIGKLTKSGKDIRINASVYVYPTVPFNQNPASLVISLDNEKKTYRYTAVYFDQRMLQLNQWNKVTARMSVPEIKSPGDVLKVYVYHPGKKSFVMDDLTADLLEPRDTL